MSIKDLRQKFAKLKEQEVKKERVAERTTWKARYEVRVYSVGVNPYDGIIPVAEGTIEGVKWWASMQSAEVGWVVTVGDNAQSKSKAYALEVITYLNTHHPAKPKEVKAPKTETHETVVKHGASPNNKTNAKNREEKHHGKGKHRSEGNIKGSRKAGRKAR